MEREQPSAPTPAVAGDQAAAGGPAVAVLDRPVTGAEATPARRLPRWARVGVAFVVVLGILGAGGIATVEALSKRYESNISRADLLGTGQTKEQAEQATVEGPMNILLIGSDSRGYGDGGQRSDTIILIHFDKRMGKAYAVSFPRDLFIPIANERGGLGYSNKINSAYSDGGAPRLVQTVQLLTRQRVDHVVIIDFKAIRSITAAVGGVDVWVDKTTVDPRSGATFKQGLNHLGPSLAEAYVRQRYDLPNGDYDRIHRQQQFLSALVKKVTSLGVLTNPIKLDRFLTAVTSALTVDNAMPIRELAVTLRDFRTDDITFLTVPTSGDGYNFAGSVIFLDKTKSDALFTAMIDDDMPAWVAANGSVDISGGR